MKQLILAVAIAASGIPAATAVNPWTLDSCINHALEHNITVKSRQLDTYSAELDITEARDRFLPQLSGHANQSFSFGRGLTGENTYANRNTSNFGVGANLSLPLFQGLSAIRRVDYAKANLHVMIEQTEAVKDDVTLNVISAYLQALYCEELIKVAEEQLRLSTVELDRRHQLLDAGKIPELDVTEAESQVAQDRLSLVEAKNNHTLALVDLAQLLELETVDGFDIAPLADESMPLLSPDEVYRNALQRNHSIVASQRSIDAADKGIALAKTGYLPTLSFNAGIGSSFYKVGGVDNESFGSQMRHNFNQSLGFSLSVPIFDAFSTRNSVRKAKVQQINARLQYDDAQRRLYKNIQQAYYQAVGADEKHRAAIVSRDATKVAFEAMQEKYNYGRANATEFEQSKSAYVKAMVSAVQARYESILRMRILQFYNK